MEWIKLWNSIFFKCFLFLNEKNQNKYLRNLRINLLDKYWLKFILMWSWTKMKFKILFNKTFLLDCISLWLIGFYLNMAVASISFIVSIKTLRKCKIKIIHLWNQISVFWKTKNVYFLFWNKKRNKNLLWLIWPVVLIFYCFFIDLFYFFFIIIIRQH